MDPKTHKNNTQLAFDILRGLWLLRDAEALLPYAKAFIHRENLTLEDTSSKPRLYTESGDYEDMLQKPDSEAKKVVIIPLHVQNKPDYVLSGCESFQSFSEREGSVVAAVPVFCSSSVKWDDYDLLCL